MKLIEWSLYRVTVWSFLENYISQGLLVTSDAVSILMSEAEAIELYKM